MCDFSGRLIAWLDGELAAHEAGEVERHVQTCTGCRERVVAYEHASQAFDAYCDAVTAGESRCGTARWKPALLGSGAVAAAILLAVLAQHPNPHLRQEITQPRSVGRAAKAPTAALAKAPAVHPGSLEIDAVKATSVGERERIRRRSIAPVAAREDVNLLPAGPTVQITIPAEAVLPPGAVPPGANFVVELSIAPDGLAQELRLRPQLAGFERRAGHP